MKKSFAITLIIFTAMLCYIIGIKVGENKAIHNARLIEVTEDGYEIDYGHYKLDDGSVSEGNVHCYTF